MKITSVFSSLLAASGIVLAASSVNPAAAITTTLGFQNIFNGVPPQGTDGTGSTSNNTNGDAFANQFTFDVVSGSGTVDFRFNNNFLTSTNNTRISQIAFSGIANLLTVSQLNVGNDGNVNFIVDNTGAFPQANNIDQPWTTALKLAATSQDERVDIGETFGIRFNLVGSNTYQSVINAITTGTLKTAIEVQAFPNGGSDAFVNSSTPVPEPITMLGLGVGTVGLGALKRKYGKKETKQKVTV
ncbi:PEP-CTERM sorting domain-containing protein [Nostoc sp. NIES-2111]